MRNEKTSLRMTTPEYPTVTSGDDGGSNSDTDSFISDIGESAGVGKVLVQFHFQKRYQSGEIATFPKVCMSSLLARLASDQF